MRIFTTLAALYLFACGATTAFAQNPADEAIRLSGHLTSILEDNARGMRDADLRDINRQLEQLIRQANGGSGGGGGGGGGDRLICRTDSAGNAAVFNLDTNAFIDRYYGQTLDTCNRIIASSRRGLTCGSDGGGKTALYSIKLDKFVDQYYGKTADDCITILNASRRDLTCASDSSGQNYAIFDLRNDRFVDSTYSKTLQQCINSI